MKTAWVPVLTVLAATLNVGLNLWLIPVWGVLASAINMAVGYAVLALLQGWLSVRLHPIGWEYARWLTLALAAGACFALGTWFDGGHLAVNLAVKSAITILVFPALLYVVPFLTPSEKEFIRSIPGRFRAIRLVSPSRSQETRA
jgi:peptidoglycan biosynthesis protein MviN/MurJ (putative lipid II flippase)